jgi:superfamily I DNA/RNA helicase
MMPVVTRAWNDLTRFQGALPFTKSVAQAISLKLWQLSEPTINADYILFDEAQDAAPVMVAVIANQTAAQLVWVGDDNQQIYSFTGAINALATVPADRQAYLTQSFRFGPAIADLANEILATLPTIMRLTGTATITSRVAALDAPRAILTRTNATAIRHVLTAIENDQRPYLVGGGKDVAAFCRAAVRLQDGLRVDHPELACFGTWGEVQEYVESDEQGDDLRLMVKLIDEFTAQAILDAVNGCAKEEDADVIVSTAHKAKGCEWDSVKVGADFPERAKMGNEERRLLYVAVTRARYEVDVTAVEFFAAVEEVAVA